MTDTNAKPYITFFVKKDAGAENAAVSYVKSAFFGSEEFQIEKPISGCEAENVRMTEITENKIYVECAGDQAMLDTYLQGGRERLSPLPEQWLSQTAELKAMTTLRFQSTVENRSDLLNSNI